MERITKIPGLERPRANDERSLQRFLDAVFDTLQVREGRTGNVLDRNITARDLFEAGSISLKLNGRFVTGGGGSDWISNNTNPVIIPPAPTGLTTSGALATIFLEWDSPGYANHAYTEVWASGTNDIGTAVLIGTSASTFYTDSVGVTATGTTKYYWIRFVSTTPRTGPYNAVSGTVGSTGASPSALLTLLSGSLTTSQLTSALSSRIDLIDAPSTTSGSVNARIKAEQDARIAQDDALAVQISSLSVSSDAGFDYSTIWYFDSGVESWTGNGTPTQSGGWLRAASHATDPYVISPSDLGISADSYPQIKARLRKVGTQTWDGRIYYKRTADSTWDVARSLQVSEPTWSSGVASVTWDMSSVWDGTIKQIRVDLSTGSDSSNYIEIDWIAVGRAAPSASTAQVTNIETAKIGYCTIGSVPSDHTTRSTCEAAGGTWNIGIPIASAVKQVAVNDGSGSVALEQRFVAQKATDDSLKAQYTVKVDANGYVSGFGLASTAVNATPYSEFAIVADKFSIAPVATNHAASDGSPFFYLTSPTTINGVTVQPGAYMKTAYIHDASIDNAKIQNLAVDNAKIANLAVSKLTTGTIGAQQIYLGNSSFLLDGATRRLTISDGTYNRVQLGDLGSGSFGLVLRDSSGNVFLNSGGVQSASYSVITGKPTQLSEINATEGSKLGGIEAGATVGAASGINLRDSGGMVLGDAIVKNQMIDPSTWVVGTAGNQPGFLQYGVASYNSVTLLDGPYGKQQPVWRGYANLSNPANSGFDTTNFNIDKNKTYRFSVWIRRGVSNSTGHALFGLGACSNLGTGDSLNTNPYFCAFIPSSLVIDRWYLFVGYVHPYQYTGTTSYGAVYDGTTGAVVLSTTDYKHMSTGAVQSMRAYMYNSLTADPIQYYANPRVDIVNGAEPSIASLLSGGVNVFNSQISIGSNGALSGAGGGQVTIGGLGYTGSLNATEDLVLSASAGVSLSGNSAYKTGASGTWDASVWSIDGYTGGAFCSAMPNQSNASLMFGLNTDPLTGNDGNSIDYAWILGSNGICYTFEQTGSTQIQQGSYTSSDIFSITYDGIRVQWFKNGTAIREVTASAGLKLFFDSSFDTQNGKIKNIRFGPLTQIVKITSGNASTYIANAAIGDAHIDRVTANKLQVTSADIVSINADKITAGTITGSTIQTASTGKRFVVSTSNNEAEFWGDAGAGVEKLVSIGINVSGTDSVIGNFTTGASTSSSYACLNANTKRGVCLLAKTDNSDYLIARAAILIRADQYGGCVSAISNYDTSISGVSTWSYGVYGGGPTDDGTTKSGIYGSGTYGIIATTTLSGKSPLVVSPSTSSSAPTHSAMLGSLWVTSTGVLYINTNGGTTWQKVGAQ